MQYDFLDCKYPYSSNKSVCHCLQLDVNNYCFVYSSLHSFGQTLTIVRQIFITEIFKSLLFSSHKTDLIFTNSVACFVLPFICRSKYSWIQLPVFSKNVNIVVSLLFAILLILYIVAFLFTCLSCKQVHYFCFCSFCFVSS